MNSALIKWLYLPDFFSVPNSTNLISECPPPGSPHATAGLTGCHAGSCGDGPLVGECRPSLQPVRAQRPGLARGSRRGQHCWCSTAVASRVPTGDFLLLLCASQQWQVFSAERTEEWQRTAGLNTDYLEPLRGEPNPVPNFIHCRWVSQSCQAGGAWAGAGPQLPGRWGPRPAVTPHPAGPTWTC